MDKTIQQSLQKLIARAEQEMPEYGVFAPIKEEFKNTDKRLDVGTVTLMIRPTFSDWGIPEPTRKMLELNVNSASELSTANSLFEVGDKKEILAALSDIDKLVKEITEAIEAAHVAFDDRDFA